MSTEILSIAVMAPLEGKEDEFIALLQEFYKVLRNKKYSRDELYRNKRSPHYINVRHWASEETRRMAQEDPEVHRYWASLGHLCIMSAVYETLLAVPGFEVAGAGI